jgi:hypothetical protein
MVAAPAYLDTVLNCFEESDRPFARHWRLGLEPESGYGTILPKGGGQSRSALPQ